VVAVAVALEVLTNVVVHTQAVVVVDMQNTH
jgi:hypothetical protein